MSAIGKVSRQTRQPDEDWGRFNSVPRIVELLALGVKLNRIAQRFGVSTKTIYNTLEAFARVARDLEALKPAAGDE